MTQEEKNEKEENQEEQEEELREEEAQEESKSPEKEESKEEGPPEWAKKMQEDNQALSQKLDRLMTSSKAPQETPGQEGTQKKPKHEDWTWEQIEAGYDKIESGEWGASERKQLRQIERDKLRHEALSQTKQETQLDQSSRDWAGKAHDAWSSAEKDIPELKDKESPVYKRALDLFLQDPASKVFIEGNKDLDNLRKFDLSLVNPRLMSMYARQAKFEIDKSKPVSQGKKGAKTALQGESMEKADESVLDKLRKEAEDANDPVVRHQAYQRFFKEQEKQKRLKKAQVV